MESPAKRSRPHSAINLVGIAVFESGAGFAPFEPTCVNVLEARYYRQAQRRRRADAMLFDRFGMSPDRRSPEEVRSALCRDALSRLGAACKSAFGGMNRKRENQIRKQKSALVYFNAWGETSMFESPTSWREAMSLDVLPSAIVRDYGITGFSCKLRGERSGFLQGLHVASDLLNAGEVETVVLCGLFRAVPVLMLSDAARKIPLHGGWPTRAPDSACRWVERVGCAILRKEPGVGVAVNVSDYFLLPQRYRDAQTVLAQKWRGHTGSHTVSLYAGMHPSAEAQALERGAHERLGAGLQYIPVCDQYGDSACLNPMLALRHLHETVQGPGERHALVSAGDGQTGVWLIECWAGNGEQDSD